MQFRRPHPWDGGYALPDNVLAEPPGRGTLTTAYTPRRTISPTTPRPPAWRSGYAVPDYVHEEPIGRGVHRTKYLPRRTVDTLVPEYLGNYIPSGDVAGVGKVFTQEQLTKAIAIIQNGQRAGKDDSAIANEIRKAADGMAICLPNVGCELIDVDVLIAAAFQTVTQDAERARKAASSSSIPPIVWVGAAAAAAYFLFGRRRR